MRYYAKLYHPDCVEAFAASWIEIYLNHGKRIPEELVEAFAASWIEIYVRKHTANLSASRSLCGFVD